MINNPQAWSEILERYGRNGDTMIAHMTPTEAALLEKRRAKSKSYKGVSYNPVTGLREFWGDSDSSANGGTGDSTGGFGDHGSLGGSESGIGGPGGDGSSQADRSDGFGGGNNGGLGGFTGFGNFDQDTSMRAGAEESEISERPGGVDWSEYNFNAPGYKQQSTWGRVAQEIASPSIKSAGRFSAPTATDMGILGPMAGFLAGPVMGLAMMAGAAMGRAQTPEQQAESMAHNQALGAQNSTGQDRDSHTGLDFASLDARAGAEAGVTSNPIPVAPIAERKPEPISQASWATSPALGLSTAIAAPFGMPGTMPRLEDYGAGPNDAVATGPAPLPDILQPVKTAALSDPMAPGWQAPESLYNSIPTGPSMASPAPTGRDPYMQYLAPLYGDTDPMATLSGYSPR